MYIFSFICNINSFFEQIKTDTVLLMLKKSVTGKTWPYVTSGEKAAKKAKDKENK